MAGPNPLEQIQDFIRRYTLRQRIAMVVSAALAMLSVWALVHFMNRVDFQTLYADLDAQEAQSIVQKLGDLKVLYELSADGRSIKVASDKLAEIRIQLASQGLPESGRIGFEIFDRTNFGLTNFQEQVNYQRAMEGELARSIMTLSEVDAARVHLVLAKESLFQTPDEQTKASVILKLKSGQTLTASAAQGIANMVASSVKGLAAEKVVLIDYRGKVMSRNETGETGLSTQQLDVRQKMETELSTKIVQILEPAVGSGRVRPQVSVMMNFQQVEETVEQYDPQGSVVRSQEKGEERQPTKTDRVGGIPGPRSTPSQNPANPAAITPQQTQGDQAQNGGPLPPTPEAVKQSETINYEVSKAVRHIVNPVGKVDKLSVAVVIDSQTKVSTGQDGTQQTTQVPHTADEMKKYRDLVAAAIGFNADRGDQLTIENVSFAGETELVEKPATPVLPFLPKFLEKQGPMIVLGARYLILPVAFIIVYLLFLRPVQKTLLANLLPGSTKELAQISGRVPGAIHTPMTVKQLEAQLSGLQSNGLSAAELQSLIPPIQNQTLGNLSPGQMPNKIEMIRQRVVEHAQSDPETVARLVRMWLSEERQK